MLTLIKLDTAVAFKAEKLGVGDVIATHNGTQHLRRIDALEVDGDSVHLFVSKPKAGGDEAILTFPKGTLVNVMGRVEEPKAPTTKVKAAPKAKTAKPKAAPVKVTKVDAVAQTTPAPIHGRVTQATGRKMTPKVETPKAASSIREAIRTELRSAVEALILTEVKALITEALA